MDEDKIFEALDKFPETVRKVDELAETVRNNIQVTSDSIKTVSSDVKGLNSRMSQMEQRLCYLKNSVDSASSAMKKEVTVTIPPVTVQKSDLNITQKPLSDSQINDIADKVAKQAAEKLYPKKIRNIILWGSWIVMIIFIVFICTMKWLDYDDDYRGWGARYVEVGRAAGDLHPGDRFLYVKEEFAKGRKFRNAAKKLIEAAEEKYDNLYRNNTRIISGNLTKALKEEVVVLDYDLVVSDSLGYEAFTIYRPEDKDVRHAAHINKNGDVLVTEDSDLITSASKARKHPGRSTWKKKGNFKK